MENCVEVQIPMPWGHVAGRWYNPHSKGRKIIAVHGWLDNCDTFVRLAPLLPADASLLCIDLPGHGYSSHLPVGAWYDNLCYVRVIRRIITAYQWQKVTLLGHSVGGSIAFNFVGLYPQLVDAVICIDTIATRVVPSTERMLYYNAGLLKEERHLEQRTVNSEPPSYTYAACEQKLYEGSRQSVDMQNCKILLTRNLAPSKLHPGRYYFSRDGRIKFMFLYNPSENYLFEIALRITELRIPLLVVKGGNSANFSNSEMSPKLDEYFQKKHPKYEIHTVPKGKHHLHLNDPQPVAELITAFLQKYPHSIETTTENATKAKL